MSSTTDIIQPNPLKIMAVTVKWEVENIWQLSFEGVSSAAFLLSDHIFHLHMRKYELGFAIYLCRDDFMKSDDGITLLCKLYMVNQIGQEKMIGEREVVIEKGKEFVLLESVMIGDLEAQKAEFIWNNTLTISCSVASSYRVNIMKQQESERDYFENRCETLSSDFENFFVARTVADVFLKTETAEFKVHQAILQARCPELLSMIESENATPKVIVISDVSDFILKETLFYIYTGKIKALKSDHAVQMLAAANKFSLAELKDICFKFLQNNLNEDNIFEAAILAQEINDVLLKEEVEQFIVRNVSILHSEKWKEFCSQRYKFANDILTDALLRMKMKNDEK